MAVEPCGVAHQAVGGEGEKEDVAGACVGGSGGVLLFQLLCLLSLAGRAHRGSVDLKHKGSREDRIGEAG